MTAPETGLDRLAEGILESFQPGETARFPKTDIDALARLYLGLTVRYTALSDDRSLLGLTAYERTKVNITVGGSQETLLLDRDTVLLEKCFLSRRTGPAEAERLSHRRRFTLAHECAHQILFRMEPEQIRQDLRSRYSARQLYSCRDLKAREDWNERQANILGAALLMPRSRILRYFDLYRGNRPLVSYGGRYAAGDRLSMTHLTVFFGVSPRSLEIRLRDLGLLTELPGWLYHNPLEIEGDL